MSANNQEKMKKDKVPSLYQMATITLTIVLLTTITGGYLYIQNQETINQKQIQTLTDQLNTANNAKNALQTVNKQLEILQDALQAQVAHLSTQNQNIRQEYQAQIDALAANSKTYYDAANWLKQQNDQYLNMLHLTYATILKEDTTINLPAYSYHYYTFDSSTINYAGYLKITYTATSWVTIEVRNSRCNPSTYTETPTSSSGTYIIPIIPSNTNDYNYITIRNPSSAPITVTFTITYYY